MSCGNTTTIWLQDRAGGVPIELRQFLNQSACARKSNPLEVWETLKHQFPWVYKVSLDYLHILATSVHSERLFSEAGIRITKQRNRLSGSHVEQLLVLGSIPQDLWFTEE